MLEIREPVISETQLREIIPVRPTNSAKKDSDRLNDVARAFLALCPFMVMSTAGREGRHAVSPKGDPAGFVHVHDERTLIIPDRLGNHRLDSFLNLLTDPRVGLIFMIPGHTETLRVAGTGQIARDESLRAPFAVNGRPPDLVLVVHVEQVFMHCSKALVRSRLWVSETWPERRAPPTLAEWVKSTVETDETLEQVQGNHDRDRETRLY